MSSRAAVPDWATTPSSPRDRTPPVGWRRILTGYLITLIAVVCGLPAAIVGFVGASRCHGRDFSCVGWVIYGLLAAALIASVALIGLAVRFRLGVWFSLVLLSILVAWVVLEHELSKLPVIAILGVAVAGWVSDPPAGRHTWARHWLPRLLVLVSSIGLLPLAARPVLNQLTRCVPACR